MDGSQSSPDLKPIRACLLNCWLVCGWTAGAASTVVPQELRINTKPNKKAKNEREFMKRGV
jgi:hypothetical protein